MPEITFMMRISSCNFVCVPKHSLGTRTKFQCEILIRSIISAIHKFREDVLESSLNVIETIPWLAVSAVVAR